MQVISKSDSVKLFLNGKNFENCTAAYKEFQRDTKIEITYAQFNGIFRAYQSAPKDVNAPVMAPVERKREKANLKSMAVINDKFDDAILTPHKSDTILDALFSIDGGVMPATVTIAPGESGVGKTTVILEYLSKLKATNPKLRILFGSSEMNEIHMFKYGKRVDVRGVEILFLGEYDRPDEVLEDILKEGWDIVFLDSFQDTIDKVKDAAGKRAGEAEQWLLSLMDDIRLGNNDRKLYTAFIATQHMTKGAVYSGSTRVKHMTDAMMELKKDGNLSYVEFTKNRDGKTRIRLYYTIKQDGIDFDLDRYERELKALESAEEVKENQKDADAKFDQWLNNNPQVATLEVAENEE